jgi:hypothetical protein
LPNGWPIRRCRLVKGERWQGGEGHRVARHVEELDGVAFLVDPWHDVALNDGADVANAHIVLGNVPCQNHGAVQANPYRVVTDIDSTF